MTVGLEQGLHAAETPLELQIPGLKGRFRIDPQLAGEIDATEQQITDFIPEPGCVTAVDLGFDLGQFLAHLAEDGFHRWPVKPGTGGAFLQLVGAAEGGKGGNNPIQDAIRGFIRTGFFCLAFLVFVGWMRRPRRAVASTT